LNPPSWTFLWHGGEGAAKAVHKGLGQARGITLNTIQSTLKRLFEKGLLSRDKVSHAHVYRPRVSTSPNAPGRNTWSASSSSSLNAGGRASGPSDAAARHGSAIGAGGARVRADWRDCRLGSHSFCCSGNGAVGSSEQTPRSRPHLVRMAGLSTSSDRPTSATRPGWTVNSRSSSQMASRLLHGRSSGCAHGLTWAND